MMKGKDKEKVKLKIKKSSWQKCLSSGSTHELEKKMKVYTSSCTIQIKGEGKRGGHRGKNPK